MLLNGEEEVRLWPRLQLKGHKGEFFRFSWALFLLYCSSFLDMMRAESAVVGGGDCIVNINK